MKYKKIFLLVTIVIAVSLHSNNILAAITGPEGTVVTSRGVGAEIADGAMRIIAKVLEFSMSGAFATLASFIMVLSIVLFLVLYIVFGVATGTASVFPLPDTIVLNKFSFFDPNFINPSNGSIAKGLSSILKNLFQSFQTIAISIFVIAAMIVGIKMAITTIAAKKAQYKELAFKWLTGFIILVCLKWIVAGIFYTNELIVSSLAATVNDVGIPVYFSDALGFFGFFGKTLGTVLKGAAQALDLYCTVPGYFGLILANLTKAIGGNLIAAIIGFILLGQTFTIIGSYIKRMFMSILLGVISPLIVAVDTVNSALGKQSNIFKNWLSNFATTVFMQTIHALYMAVILQAISILYSTNGNSLNQIMGSELNEAQIGIIVIALTTGLVKLEKMIKSLFGIGDSFAGSLKDGSKGMLKALGAVKGIQAAATAVKDNGKKAEAARRMRGNTAGAAQKAYYEKAKEAKASGNMDDYHKYMKEAAKIRKDEKDITGSATDLRSIKNTSTDTLQNIIEEQTQNQSNANANANTNEANTKKNSVKQSTNNPEDDILAYNEAVAYSKSARLAQTMAPVNIIAGFATSFGMEGEITDSMFEGGYFAKYMDKGTERLGYKLGGGKVGYKEDVAIGKTKGEDGKSKSITRPPTERVVEREKIIEKSSGVPNMVFNPMFAMSNMKKQIDMITENFGDAMKKKIKEIDKDDLGN